MHRFFGWYLLTMAGNLGLILSLDMVSFYLCFALMSLAAYGMIVHDGSHQAFRAGRVYIGLVVMGEVALFAGMVLATMARGIKMLRRPMQALMLRPQPIGRAFPNAFLQRYPVAKFQMAVDRAETLMLRRPWIGMAVLVLVGAGMFWTWRP